MELQIEGRGGEQSAEEKKQAELAAKEEAKRKKEADALVRRAKAEAKKAARTEKLEAMSELQRGKIKAAKLLQSASSARCIGQQLLVLDADEKSRVQIMQYADNCDKNHTTICALIERGCTDPSDYKDVNAAIDKGFAWFDKKGSMMKSMIASANRRMGSS